MMIMQMSRKISLPRVVRLLSSGALALGLTCTIAAHAAVHDHGVLKLVSKTFKVGDSLVVRGSKFTKNDAVTLALIGLAGRVRLAETPTDSAGAFSRAVLVPLSLKAGQYRLVAEAIDGDEVATLDVVVQPAFSQASMEGMVHGGADHAAMQMGPTGEPLELDRARSVFVTVTAVLLIIASATAGAAMLRRPRTHILED